MLPPELVGPLSEPSAPKALDTAQQRPPLNPSQSMSNLAERAKLHVRHKGIFLSFFLTVFLPVCAVAAYLFLVAKDQFASTIAFSVHSDSPADSLAPLNGLVDFAPAGPNDADIIYAYIRSQKIVRRIQEHVDLRATWARVDDPIYALNPEHNIEKLLRYWRQMVRVRYDTNTNLIEVRVNAFDPIDAQNLATAIFEESDAMVNRLSAQVQAEALEFSKTQLDVAQHDLDRARIALTTFRNTNQVVDPSVDLAGQMGLLNSLEAQHADALIALHTLQSTQTRRNDPRLEQTKRRVEVVQNLIEQERLKFQLSTPDSHDYGLLIDKYERLIAEREFANATYIATRQAYDAIASEALRRQKHLVAHVPATLSEHPQYPRRALTLALFVTALLLVWSICVLIYYSVRDRR